MKNVILGVGWAQLSSNIALSTYYCSLMAITLFYLIVSFSSELPWSKCQKEWGDNCIDSGATRHSNNVFVFSNEEIRSSAELYFSYV